MIIIIIIIIIIIVIIKENVYCAFKKKFPQICKFRVIIIKWYNFAKDTCTPVPV